MFNICLRNVSSQQILHNILETFELAKYDYRCYWEYTKQNKKSLINIETACIHVKLSIKSEEEKKLL